MDQVYFHLVKAGRRTIEQVPQALREAVEKLLKEDGDKNAK